MDKDVLRFGASAKRFEESCVIGNGKLGAVVYGGTEKERVFFNIDSLWSGTAKPAHNKKGAARCGEITKLVREGTAESVKKAEKLFKKYISGGDTGAYMPLADLEIVSDEVCKGKYFRALDMRTGIVKISAGSSREYFVSHPDNVAVLRYEKEGLDLKIKLTSKLRGKSLCGENFLGISGYAPCYTSNTLLAIFKRGLYDRRKQVIRFRCALRVVTDGKTHNAKGYLHVSNATYAEIYFTADTSRDDPAAYEENVVETLEAAVSKGYSAIRGDHIADFTSLYDRCSFELTGSDYSGTVNQELERFELNGDNLAPVVKLFNLGRYLMISGSRPGTYPLNLQGIWQVKKDPPWSSNYTTNINTEMNYWAVNAVNLSECEEPLLDHIGKMRAYGELAAKETYGSAGWVSGHNSDVFGKSAPVGRISFGSPCTFSPCLGSSGWLCLHLYEHYEYTLDREWLAEYAYPIMKGAAEFYLDNLREGPNGLVLAPGASPENRYVLGGKRLALAFGTTFDNSVAKQLFSNILSAADKLGIDDEFTRKIKNVIPRMRPFMTGRDGRLLEWDREYVEADVRHRHISHLYGNHPAHLINEETPELREAVKRSLDARGDDGTGWAIAWKVNQWARLRDGERAYKLIKRHLRRSMSFGTKIYRNGGTYPNYLCAHPPFQIDGNFGIMSGIAEMLMQSEEGAIHILPAIPAKWSGGTVKGMKAKGGYTVSFTWRDGNVEALIEAPDGTSGEKIYVTVCGKIVEAVTGKEFSCYNI